MARARADEVRPGGGRERREHRRAEAPWPVHLLLAGGHCEARLRDVSRSGVCFFIDRPIGLMTVLDLELQLSVAGAERTVKGRGAVVRCERISPAVEHYEVAVFLHEMDEADREAIDQHVRSRVAAG